MKKLTSHNKDWNGTEIEVGSRLTLILGEPHQAGIFFNSLRGYFDEPSDTMGDVRPTSDLYDTLIPRSTDCKSSNFHYVLDYGGIIEGYKDFFKTLYRLSGPHKSISLSMPETNLSERLQVALIQEAIKSGKRLFIYTQSEVILLECMLGIKEGLLNLEEVKLYMVEDKEVTDVELLKGGKFKSFGDSFPGTVKLSQMKRYVGF